MLRIILVFIFSFVVIGCGGSDSRDSEVVEVRVRPDFDTESTCEDAAMVEPLPDGNVPVSEVGTWSCSATAPMPAGVTPIPVRSTTTINSNGSFRTTILSGAEYPADFREQWNKCRIGTAPPVLAGHFVSTDTQACIRYDVMPFRYLCGTQDRINQSGQRISLPGTVEVYEYGSFVRSYSSQVTSVCEKQ